MVFGCQTYANIIQGKLAPRALKGTFISYFNGVKGHKLCYIDLSLPKCIISRDVVLNEEKVIFKHMFSFLGGAICSKSVK